MAKIRRVVRKLEPAAAHYFDEQLWPVSIALVALGGFLIGVSLAYQPLSGVSWYRTAWPSLIGIPLIVIAAIVALARIDSRLVRRSLQLSLVLCAIVHLALVVQMMHTQLLAGAVPRQASDPALVGKRPPKLVPEYHPTQLVPEESRPRQDFEKPVEAQSPEPIQQPEQIVRQPLEREQSPSEPQPVPIPEQTRTIEPNVVNRPRPNEVAPRLASQQSQLSRQAAASQSRLSQPVAMPEAEQQPAKPSQVRPSDLQVERQRTEPATARRAKADAPASPTSREAALARRTEEPSPKADAAPRPLNRQSPMEPTPAPQAQVVVTEPPAEATRSSTAQPRQTNVTQQKTSAAVTPQKSQEAPVVERNSSPSLLESRRVAASVPAAAPRESQPSPPRTSAAAPTPAMHVPVDRALAAAATRSEPAAQAAPLALSRAEAGAAGSRRSPNFDASTAGAASPALVSSSAARRAEATQREAPGDALSPSATARLARSRASAEIPTATVKAEQLENASAPGAAQVAEVTASSGAALTTASAAARRDAITAAKGTGEIDFGPTQIVAEPGSGRAAGGGQPELNSQAALTPLARSATGAPPTGAQATAADIGPASAMETTRPPSLDAASLAMTAVKRTDGVAASSAPAGTGPKQSLEAASSSVARESELRIKRSEDGPRPADIASGDPRAAASGAPSREVEAPATGGATSVADIPEVGPRSAVAQAELDHVSPGIAQTALKRGGSESLAVDIESPAGPGGLGTEYTPEVGINSRQASDKSLNVELRAARFLRSQVGGLPAVSTAAVVPTDAFSSRAARVRGEERTGGSGSQSPQTEEAIERGLAFLARYQRPTGGWSLQGFPEGATLVSDTAATALAVLAFQGAGYNHREFQYRDVVRGGLAYLLKGQQENGDLFVPLDDASNKSVWLYSHALAAIAVCEAYGMTQDPDLRRAAQKAIDFLVDGQEQERGGWRYAPGVGADTSVTGWVMMALKSGELAGLDVPPAAYRRIRHWLDDAQQSKSEPYLYRYNPYAPDTPEQRHGRAASKTMTAVGLLMRLYSGWHRDNPNMVRGAAFLAEHLPSNGTARDPQRDTYYWYYATQVMAHMGGDRWQAWMGQLHPLIVNAQIRQGPFGGSWDPRGTIADRWGPHAGRLYVTTMNLLSLEVQHRKLPLYEDVVR